MTQPIWDAERIAQELAERSAPDIITVEAAKEVIGEMQDEYADAIAALEMQAAALQAHIEDLEDEVAALQNPADVVVTVGVSPVGVSQFVTGMQDVDAPLRTSVVAQDKLKVQMQVMASHIMNFGAPNLWPKPEDGKPTNWSRLDDRMNMFVRMGAKLALIFYNYPIWMKEVIGNDGKGTPCDLSDPFATDGRVRLDMLPQFYTYCKEVALRYMRPPYNVRILVFGNEFKGYYYRKDGSDGLDVADYTVVYNEWVRAIEDAAAALNIASTDLKVGGSGYAPIRSEGAPSSKTYEQGRIYGYFRKAPFDAIRYWLQHATRQDFVAFDMGAGNAVGPELTDTFTVQQNKWKDAAAMIREMTNLPLLCAETYPKCADDQNADARRVAAAKMVAHLEMVNAGYWMAWAWGAIGQGEYHEINKNGGLLKDYATGDTNPWYEAHAIIKQFFGSGARLYDTQVEGEGVYAKATDSMVAMVNMTDTERRVRLDSTVHVLAPYQVAAVAS
jgi:hypothetical protein